MSLPWLLHGSPLRGEPGGKGTPAHLYSLELQRSLAVTAAHHPLAC